VKHLTDIVLNAYRGGAFPMAESAEDDNFAFYKPYMRGIIPISGLHIPAKLLKEVRQEIYTVTMDQAFEAVIDGCALETPKRAKTWINTPIRDIFIELHKAGHAHSIECWTNEGKLAGGLYGLAIGAQTSAMPAKSRSCIYVRHCGRVALPCWTRNSSTRICCSSARMKWRRKNTKR
jgi:leucyl/phenylalanyl-tRNA--protein transferase